jgi:hypothetical protein
VANVGVEPPEILELIVDATAEADAASAGKGERQLTLAKEAFGAQKGQGHGAELTQQAMPFFDGGMVLGQGEVPQDLLKRSCRLDGSLRVIEAVLMIQPRRCLRVSQWALPLSNFFTEEGSFRVGGSSGSGGQNIWWMA